MNHPLLTLKDQVEKTHPGLGQLTAAVLLSVKASKCMLVVAPAGCGKSAALKTIADQHPAGTFMPDSITRASLRKFSDTLSNWNGLAACDDFAAADNWYNRMATLTTYAKMVYDRRVEKHTMTYDIKIENFNGSAVINIQPIWFDTIVKSPEWEGLLRDKTLRYYHLYFPVKPQLNPPTITVDWGKSKPVKLTNGVTKSKTFKKLMDLGGIQWGRARAKQHIHDLVSAATQLRKATVVSEVDVKSVYTILKPMMLEYWLVGKTGFESGRYFLVNPYYILTVLASFKRPTLDTLRECFKVSRATAYKLLSSVSDYVELSLNSPKVLVAKPPAVEILKAVKG